MKNSRIFVLVCVWMLLLTACMRVEKVVEEPSEVVDTVAPVTPEEEVSEEIEDLTDDEVIDDVDEELEEGLEEELDASVASRIDELVADEDLKQFWSYLQEILPEVNGTTAEYALIGYMTVAESLVFSFDDLLFTEAGYEMQSRIYDIYEDNRNDFELSHLIVGEDKYVLYDKMPEENKPILKDVLDEGYGLINMEGDFYRIVDYKQLHDRYGDRLSDMSEAYLDIQASILMKQTTVEEYLQLTPNELMNRCILLESYLMTYPEMPQLYNDMIIWQFNIALYKLALPNPFDGTVEEDGTLSDDFEAMYAMLLQEEPTPIVTQVVKEFTAWVESREDGYIGSYMDTEELFEASGEIYGRATEKIAELYQ